MRNDGYRNSRTTTRSIILVSMGVTDIGRKSECCTGAVTFGIGLIRASFHCRGTVDVERDMLKICVVDL